MQTPAKRTSGRAEGSGGVSPSELKVTVLQGFSRMARLANCVEIQRL
jgi:hypothetical protein